MKAVEQQMLQDGLLPCSCTAGSTDVPDNNTSNVQQASSSDPNSAAAPGAADEAEGAGTTADADDSGVSSGNIVSDYVNAIELPAEDSILAASRVVSLGSFSKIMAPGLRLG